VQRVRLNEGTDSALMNDGGKHYMLSSYVRPRPHGSRFLGLKFSIKHCELSDEHLRMSVSFSGCRLYVTCKQDFDNSRGIGFQEVCACTYPQVVRILSVCAQFEALWNYITVSRFQQCTLSRLTL
jgi:hypothetical protein